MYTSEEVKLRVYNVHFDALQGFRCRVVSFAWITYNAFFSVFETEKARDIERDSALYVVFCAGVQHKQQFNAIDCAQMVVITC